MLADHLLSSSIDIFLFLEDLIELLNVGIDLDGGENSSELSIDIVLPGLDGSWRVFHDGLKVAVEVGLQDVHLGVLEDKHLITWACPFTPAIELVLALWDVPGLSALVTISGVAIPHSVLPGFIHIHAALFFPVPLHLVF